MTNYGARAKQLLAPRGWLFASVIAWRGVPAHACPQQAPHRNTVAPSSFSYMGYKVRPSTRELARYITRAVSEATDGQPRRWRMLSSIPGATADSVLYAKEQGWIELEGAHSACLTEEGRRLIAKESH